MQVISTLERNILELKQQIMERNDIIEDKEKRILDLKRNNQELEKFKVVLEHKIEEFKTQIVAREAEVTSTKDCVMVEGPFIFMTFISSMLTGPLYMGSVAKHR